MKQDRNPIRLLAEILFIVAVAQAAVMLALPGIATGFSAHSQVLLGTALLVLLAGPTVYWRCMATRPRQAPASTGGKSARTSTVNSAIAMTAAAQAFGLVLTGASVMWQSRSVSVAAQAKFDRGAERIEAEVRRHFALPVYGLNGLNGLFAAHGHVTRSEFRTWVESRNLPAEFPGVRGLGFIERVERSDLARFVAEARSDSAPGFAVPKAGDAADLYVVKFIEPMASNRAILGLDAGREAMRREAAERAVDSGLPTLSGRIVLAQGDKTGPGLLYLVPVYRSGTVPTTREQRRAMLVGVLFAPIVAGEIMKGVTDIADGVLDIELFDGAKVDATKLLFDSRRQVAVTPQDAGNLGTSSPAFLSQRSLVVGGRTLALRVAGSPAFEASIDRSGVALVAVGGASASFLMALAVWLLAVGRVRAERQAGRMTADLARLARVVQHTSNSVAITDAELRINWVNAGFTRITGYTQEEAIGRTPGALVCSTKADPAAIELLRNATAAGVACRVEVLNRTKDGREYWIDTELQPMRDENGVLTGFMEIGSDITAIKAVQQQLSATTDRMTLAIEGSRDGLWDWMDVTDDCVWWSPSFYAMLGYQPAELAASLENFSALIHPDQLASFQQAAADALSGSKAFDMELLLRTHSGVFRWFRSRAKVYRDAQGSAVRMAGSMQDIHDRKQADQALRESEAFLDRAGRIAGVGGWRVDLRSGDIIWSAQTCRIHEVEPGHRPSMEEATSYYAPGSRERIESALQDSIHNGSPFDLELAFVTAKGRPIWVRAVGEVEFEGGTAVRLVGAFQDITERRALGEELRRSNELMASVLESVPCGLSVFNDKLQLVTYNSQFRQLLNLPDGLFNSSDVSFERFVRFSARRGVHGIGEHGGDELGNGEFDSIVAAVVEQARLPSLHSFELVVPGAAPLEVRRAPMPGGGFVTTYADISTRKQAELLLKEALSRAEQASVTKSQFLANMSHEIRTPMNAILGMLSLLQKTPLTTRQLDYAAKTEGAARSLLGLLNDILDFSKAEAGKMSLDPRPFSVDRLLRDLSMILSANVGAKTIEVLFDIDPALPIGLLGDDMRLQQVLINLCGNAIKFTSEGEVVLSLRVADRTDEDVLLAFAVRDSGIGIAPEHQAHIFTGFSQAEASTTRRFGGTGLGLAICQRLVALMGGELRLDSTPGQGSTFHFQVRLPLAEPPEDALAPCRPGMGALRTLIVDDNARARETFVGMAQSLGWQVDAVASGAEALTLAAARAAAGAPFEAVLLDGGMPDMDGWETGRRLLANALANALANSPATTLPTPSTALQPAPLLVMTTGHGRENLAQRSAEDQALLSGFLVKPMTASMLFDAVSDARAALAQPELPRRPAAPSVQRLLGMRLLLVEDNLNNQQVAQELLADEGALVTLAANGLLGVDAVATAAQPFDAVMMDVQMPVMDGYTATAQIRQRLGLTALPIIAMTANAMATDREACLAAGMNDHVGKPFDLSSLVATLLRHTGRAAAAAVSTEAKAAALPARLLEEAGRRGIDLAAALGRLGGNSRVYLRTLPSFVNDLTVLPDRLAPHLLHGRFDAARELLHTFKGLAATLGIEPLARLAADFEARLADLGSPLDHAPLAEQLSDLVVTTLEDITWLAEALQGATARPAVTQPLARVTGAPNPGEMADVRDSLQELAGLLRRADMRALEVFEHLQQTHAIHLEESMRRLDDAMAALDFDQALAHCRDLQLSFDN